MRWIIPSALGLFVTACAAPAPDDSAPKGVGFDEYSNYAVERTIREAELSGEAVPDGPVISEERLADVATDNPDISDEQDFEAVSARETIESDAERRARQQEALVVVEPTDLPSRPGGSGPSIVEFALSTTNAVGQSVHRRGNTSQSRFERACNRYTSPDQAQLDFLQSGGPERDRRGVDPDGDGFACDWDPTPFRNARG